ncbi:MAG TPA: hypothetical protein VME42_11630 [Steroidobacteraceae bacterium]|nr:hypothetical protein [Steroidobacteraceae bacterium]
MTRRTSLHLPARTARCLRSGAVSLAGVFLLCTASLADGGAAQPLPGTWQSHKYTFQFMGFTSTYSCDGLADKLRKLLLAAGARPDLKSEPGACASGFGRPDKFARADLTFSTLVPAEGGGAHTVMGNWRSVVFAHHSPRDLGLGDCELVEQFRSQLLPMFTTSNIVNHTTCIPYQESGSTIDLQFDAFSAVPAKKRPAGGGG